MSKAENPMPFDQAIQEKVTNEYNQFREEFDKAFAEGQSRGRDEAFDLATSELEKVLDLSIFYDKPGLRTALAVVKNTRRYLDIKKATT